MRLCSFRILWGGCPAIETGFFSFFFVLPIFQVASRPHPRLPIGHSVSSLCVSRLFLLCAGFFAWPANSSFCSPQVCFRQTSQIDSHFDLCLSSYFSIYLILFGCPSPCLGISLIPCPNWFCFLWVLHPIVWKWIEILYAKEYGTAIVILSGQNWVPVPLIFLLVSSSLSHVPRQPDNMQCLCILSVVGCGKTLVLRWT